MAARLAVMDAVERNWTRFGLPALAALALMLHLGGMAAQRESLQASAAASDLFRAGELRRAQAMVAEARAQGGEIDPDARAQALGEAMRLRGGSKAGEGLDDLARRQAQLQDEAARAAMRQGGLGLAEAGLLVAMVLIGLGEAAGIASWMGRAGWGLAAVALGMGMYKVLGG